MEFFKPHTGNEENRRLNEGNAIASALDNFNSVPLGEPSSIRYDITGPEWEQPMSISVEIGETDYLPSMQSKCLLVGEQGTGDANAKLSGNQFSLSYTNGKEMLQDKAEPDIPGNEETTGANILEPEAWFKRLVEISDRNKNRGGGKGPAGGKWTDEEDKWLMSVVEQCGPKHWKNIAEMLGGSRSGVQCLHRWNKVLRPGLHKGPWTEQEDGVVKSMVNGVDVGKVQWNSVAAMLPGRIGKQCRERWFNFLDPSIKRTTWTDEEDNILFESQRCLGNRWCEIVKLLPGRPENSAKNRFNSSARKKWNKANPVSSKSTISPELLSTLKDIYEQNQKVVCLRQEQKKARRKTVSHNNWPILADAAVKQPLDYGKGDEARVNLPEIRLATERNVAQTTEWCPHDQQHVNQLQSMSSYASIDIEGGNNSIEVNVADKCMPDFPDGQCTAGVYSGEIGNLNNIPNSSNSLNSSVNGLISDIDKKIALNMLYDTQQQQLPSLKKHKRDDSGDSFMSETTISCIKALGATIGTSPENGVGQDTVDKLYFDSNRSMPKSVTTIDSEANCTNEIARRANGVFVRDFVPISLMPYFKYLNAEAQQDIMSQLSGDYSMRCGMLKPYDNHSLMPQQKIVLKDGGNEKNSDVAYNQQAMSWDSFPDSNLQHQVNQIDTHTGINISGSVVTCGASIDDPCENLPSEPQQQNV